MQRASTRKKMVVLRRREQRESCFIRVVPWSEGDFCGCTYMGRQGNSLGTSFTEPDSRAGKSRLERYPAMSEAVNVNGFASRRSHVATGTTIGSVVQRMVRIRPLIGRHKDDRNIIGIDTLPFSRFANDRR